MPKPAPICPCCNLGDRAYKVSILYLEASVRLHHHETANQPELDAMLEDLLPPDCTEQDQAWVTARMLSLFTPPAGKQVSSRQIHPDWMIFFLIGIGIVFAYSAATKQPAQLPAIIGLILLSLLIYWRIRKTAVLRYERQIREEEAEKEAVERAVARWMRLYFCTRDQCIFDPQENRSVPLERLKELLSSSMES